MTSARRYPETKIKSAILAYLRTQRDVWAERRNAGSRLITAKGMVAKVAFGEPGTPDITGYLKYLALRRTATGNERCSLPFGIEVKRPGQRLNANQKAWHAKAGEFGIPVAVCTSISDARAFIERLRRGEWSKEQV